MNTSIFQHHNTPVGLLFPRQPLLYGAHTRKQKVGHKHQKVNKRLTRWRARRHPVKNLVMSHSNKKAPAHSGFGLNVTLSTCAAQ